MTNQEQEELQKINPTLATIITQQEETIQELQKRTSDQEDTINSLRDMIYQHLGISDY